MSKKWQSKSADLVFSVLLAISFPFVANILYIYTGAFFPMLLYYGLAWGMVKWRWGSTGYFNKLSASIST